MATRNSDKLKEIRTLLTDLTIDLIDLDSYPEIPPVEETGVTLQENAFLKARTIHAATGIPAIADDTGLEVDALDGAPGVYSARFAGADATYHENVVRLLTSMEGVPAEERTARFRTSAVYVDDNQEISAEGTVEGAIALAPVGKHGFGYDPIFVPQDQPLTFGQMTDHQKNDYSHRARAFVALQDALAVKFSINSTKELPASTH